MNSKLRSLIPLLAVAALLAGSAQAADQTVSGSVTNVSDNSFTIQVAGEENKTMDFVTNENTRIEGNLEVGSNVEVTYHTEDGNNIATHVKVEEEGGN